MMWQSFMNHWVYALLDSIWQFAMMWFLFVLGKQLLSKKYLVSFAFFLVNAGTCWFILQLVFSFSFSKLILQQTAENSFPRLSDYSISFSNWMLLVAALIHSMFLIKNGVNLVFGMINLSKFKRASSSEDHWGVGAVSSNIARSLQIKRKFQLLYSTKISSPIMAGHFKPFLIFPLPMMNELTLEQIKLLLIHEYAHLLHKDFLLNFWMKTLECIFFFNPFFKKLAIAIEFEMECRTDAQVVHTSNQSREYIELLLQLARKEKQYPLLAKGFHGNGNSGMLLQRVKRMLGERSNYSTSSSMKHWSWLFISIAISVCIQFNKAETIQMIVTSKSENFKTIRQPIIFQNSNSSDTSKKDFVKKDRQKVNPGMRHDKQQSHDEISLRIASSLKTIHQDLMSIHWVMTNPNFTTEIQTRFIANPVDSSLNQPTENKQYEKMISTIMQLNAELIEQFNSKILTKESDLNAFTIKLDDFRKKLEGVQNFMYNQSPVLSSEEEGLEFTERMMNLNALLDHHKTALEFWIDLGLQSKKSGKSGNKHRIVDL